MTTQNELKGIKDYTSLEAWDDYSQWVCESLVEELRKQKNITPEAFFDKVSKSKEKEKDFTLDWDCAMDILVAYDEGESAIKIAERVLCEKIKRDFLKMVR